MKTKLLFSFILFSGFINAQDFQWAKSGEGSAFETGQRVATDTNGNVYVTGYFDSSSITFGTTTLTNSNTSTADIFVVKYDANGNVLWATSTGGTNNDQANDIATDTDGNVFITGSFQSSSITFGSTVLSNTSSAGSLDIFVVKYNSSGNVVWAKSVGGTGGTINEEGEGIATDTNGNVLVTGYVRSSSVNFGTTALTSSGQADIFIVKYDTNGNTLWARRDGGGGADYGNSIATDPNGNLCITGYFYSGTITIGSDTLTNNSQSSLYDIIVVKYDANGNPIWARSAGGNVNDYGLDLVTDSNGNVFVTGFFTNFAITFGSTTLQNSGTKDLFVVKYDTTGNVAWANKAGGTDNEEGLGIATDNNGNVYVTGYFYSSSINFGATTLNQTGASDIYIVKYDNNGNVLWARSTGGIDIEQAYGIATSGADNIYLTGTFLSSTIPFGTTTLVSAGNYDAFTAKIGQNLVVSEHQIQSIKIYPNPFSEYINLETEEPLDNADIILINSMGQTVKEIRNISGTNLKISRNNLSPGIYFLKLNQNEKLVIIKKVVISE